MYYNLVGAMINVINNINDYSNFKDVITKHFKIKKNDIVNKFNKKINSLPDDYIIPHKHYKYSKLDLLNLVNQLQNSIDIL